MRAVRAHTRRESGKSDAPNGGGGESDVKEAQFWGGACTTRRGVRAAVVGPTFEAAAAAAVIININYQSSIIINHTVQLS